MATKSIKTTRPKTSAPKRVRARKSDAPSARDMQPTHEMIALRAYELWRTRGGGHGCDVEDWLAAEHELTTS
jgi:hypothetical protein